MTYNDLYKVLSALTDEQRMQTVTVHMSEVDEFYPATSVRMSDTMIDQLDPGHFYLLVN
jgi:hypothetical protein